jgi:hypothetical protein
LHKFKSARGGALPIPGDAAAADEVLRLAKEIDNSEVCVFVVFLFWGGSGFQSMMFVCLILKI